MDDMSKLGPITFRVGRCARCEREAKVYSIERPTDTSDKDNLVVSERRICGACLKWAMEARQPA